MLELPSSNTRIRVFIISALSLFILFIIYDDSSLEKSCHQPKADIKSPHHFVNDQSTTFTTSKTIPSNAAVIINDHPIDSLVPLLLHFSAILGSEWPIVLFTSTPLNATSVALKRAIDESRVQVKYLPGGIHVSTRAEYTRILTTSWIWEQLASAEHIFIFQPDSMICANSPFKLDDFLEYDFIAAPYARWIGEDTRDGLSLRNRTMTLEIIRDVDFGTLTGKINPDFENVESEQQWLHQKMIDRSEKSGIGYRHGYGARLPSREVAMSFAVARVWRERPFGYQQLGEGRWDEELDEWCPEYHLAVGTLPEK